MTGGILALWDGSPESDKALAIARRLASNPAVEVHVAVPAGRAPPDLNWDRALRSITSSRAGSRTRSRTWCEAGATAS